MSRPVQVASFRLLAATAKPHRLMMPRQTSFARSALTSHRYQGLGCLHMAGVCTGVSPTMFHRAYSTSKMDSHALTPPPPPTAELGAAVPDVHQMAETSIPAFETLEEISRTWGPGDLHAAGLGSFYTPVGLLENCLDYIHLSGGLPWWATIVATTVSIRLLMLPLLLKGMRNGIVMHNIKPEIDQLTNKAKELMDANRTTEAQVQAQKVRDLWAKHDVHPIRSVIVPLVQMPLFISFFFAVRNMTGLPVSSMMDGGILWFQDLTLSDPYYILPVLSATTMLVSAELGAEGIPAAHNTYFKYMIRGLACISVPVTGSFPAGVFMYWTSANMFSLSQLSLLKLPALRNALNLPERLDHDKINNRKSGKESGVTGFITDVKKGYNSVMGNKEQRKLYSTKPPKRNRK